MIDQEFIISIITEIGLQVTFSERENSEHLGANDSRLKWK